MRIIQLNVQNVNRQIGNLACSVERCYVPSGGHHSASATGVQLQVTWIVARVRYWYLPPGLPYNTYTASAL
jgi:hypothetical protein